MLNSLGTPRDRWDVCASDIARRTHNPIRAIVENIVVEPNPNKKLIALSIGDPTTFGNLKPPREVIEALQQSVASFEFNGYAPSTGHQIAREAVAEYCSTENLKVEAKDVILCSGCSCALDLCITVLAKEGQNILIPRPGFSLYRTLAVGLGVGVRAYNLLPDLGWEIDLDHLASLVDERTAAIIVNNPSNPCGSVYSRHHLLDIIDVAAKYHVPIIADEIYEHMVFPGRTFYPMASLSTEVPILSCSGLAKRFLVPGWRMGWVIIHDRQNIFNNEIRNGLQSLSQRIIGSSTIIQGALPGILKNTPQRFFDDVTKLLYNHSITTFNLIKEIPGLKPIMPDGAMYMMVHIDLESFPEFNTEVDFVERLLMEESVFCLPGGCFDLPSYIRLVITVPVEMQEEACKRIHDFCYRHHCKTQNLIRNSIEGVEIPY
ncbi:Similar to Tat: Tyrosine aminotransferase (Mus musculus) [Cotesia congregata]|uniref:Tyrosine aminotransferase n=1 Tax=Cotesia congregata TaxID=51543 RepID=A0A8J2HFT0_COTCN|nr:Similar to Tat: Tyrosine aminotransferase (Mus musculus) [Cotesia congregata]